MNDELESDETTADGVEHIEHIEPVEPVEHAELVDDVAPVEHVEVVEKADHDRRSRLFVPAFLIGWAVIIYGAMTALDDARDAHPFALLVHVIAFDLGHDLLLVPTALLIGWIVGKLVPAIASGPVRSALAVSAMFAIFSYPLIRRWGQRPTNSSTLPLDYGRNLTIVLVLVWIVALATIAVRVRSDRRPS